MNRRSFLSTLSSALISVVLARELGAAISPRLQYPETMVFITNNPDPLTQITSWIYQEPDPGRRAGIVEDMTNAGYEFISPMDVIP